MPLERKRESQRIVDKAQQEIDRLFPAQDTIDTLMRTQYLRLSWVTDGFRALTEKKILDIGCGAKPRLTERQPELRSGTYEAWFARFAVAAGAKKVIGLDRRPSKDENYTHVQGDIRDPQTLRQFDDESFDIVNSSAFLIPPSRQQASSLGIDVTTPELLRQFGDAQLELLDHAITQEVTRMLREGGFFLYNESTYQKKAGQLHEVERATLFAEQGFPVLPRRPENLTIRKSIV